MQLFALDSLGVLVGVRDADKGKNYICLECGAAVRLRWGERRRAHFYHWKSSDGCRLSGKSEEHLQMQSYLQMILPGEVALEVPFPTISRIADVVWYDKKIIFEVQCSPITAEEVEGRNRDYGSLGFKVVWLLHEERFGHELGSGAEEFLWNKPHYFFACDGEELCHVYDRCSLGASGSFRWGSVRLPVVLLRPFSTEELKQGRVGKYVSRRLEGRSFYFAGDLFDCLMRGVCSPPLQQDVMQLEEWLLEGAVEERSRGWYQRLFYWVLERSC